MSRARAHGAGPAALAALALAACHGEYEPVPPGLRVLGGPLEVAEAGGTATFQVALTVAPQAAVDVDVLSEDATEGSLLGPAGGAPGAWIRLRFTPSDWDAPQAVTVAAADDALRDGDVAWRVRLEVAASDDAAYAAAPGAWLAVTTLDDDAPGIRLSRTLLATAETGDVTDAFLVSLAAQPSSVVTVQVTSGDPSEGLLSGGARAVAPAASLELVFTPSSWSTPQAVTVAGVDDDDLDGDQLYAVTVGPAAGDPAYAALLPQEVAVVNADTDVAAVVLSIGLTSFSEGTGVGIAVRLAARPAGPVLVPVVSGDLAEAYVTTSPEGAPPGGDGSIALAFDAASWSEPRTVYVFGRADFVVDGARVVAVRFGPPTGDPRYAALPARTVDVTVTDQDSPAAVILSKHALSLQEEAASCGWFTVRLSTVPSEPVTVRIASGDTTEVRLASVMASAVDAESVTFRFDAASFAVEHWVEACGVADRAVDGAQTVALTVGPPAGDPRYAALPPSPIAVTVADADVPGIRAWTSGRWTTEGTSSTVWVSLAVAPVSDVTVPVASSDPAEGRVSAGGSSPAASVALVFTPQAWNVEQEVTVSGVDDDLLELDPPHPFAIRVGPASSASGYDGVSGPTIEFTNADDEVAPTEGTLDAPVEPTSLPRSGQVGTGSSHYRLTGFPLGGIVRVKDATGPVSLAVLEDGPAHATLCAPDDLDPVEACAVRLPPGGSLVVRVDGSATYNGAAFTLDAAPFTMAADVPLPIEDGAATISDLALSDVPPDYAEVAVFLDVAHPWVADLEISLRPPGGAWKPIWACSNVTGADFDRTVLFDSLALTYVCAATAPFAGTLHATPPYADPAAVNGTWTLEIRDVATGNGGTLEAWGLAAR